MSIVIFILVLSVLIIVHEIGHFWMARRLGVRVEEFALGFGPKLCGWKDSKGTEYRLCAILLGGYVKMAGDERAKCAGASDEFFSKPVGHRALIALMGPAVNFALAYCCFVVVFLLGYVDMQASAKQIPAKVGKVMVASPAEKAGLKEEDMIVKVNGKDVSNWSDMQEMISASTDKVLTLVVKRNDQQMPLTVTPEIHKVKDIFGRERAISRVGIQQSALDASKPLVIRRYGFIGALKAGGVELYTITIKTVSSLWEIVTGQRSAKEGMTGLIGIFFIVKFALGIGFAFLLHIVGVISASLAIFNLLPLVPLDGGHIALLGLEKVRRRPLSDRTDDLLSKAGFFLFIALALYVFFIDFERIGLIDKIVHIFQK
jgi:regulator of sigma E protease